VDPRDALDELARDREHGATEIVREAARLLPVLAARADQPR
jgi:hypothetical protein